MFSGWYVSDVGYGMLGDWRGLLLLIACLEHSLWCLFGFHRLCISWLICGLIPLIIMSVTHFSFSTFVSSFCFFFI